MRIRAGLGAKLTSSAAAAQRRGLWQTGSRCRTGGGLLHRDLLDRLSARGVDDLDLGIELVDERVARVDRIDDVVGAAVGDLGRDSSSWFLAPALLGAMAPASARGCPDALS
jgi:hypothetical protein